MNGKDVENRMLHNDLRNSRCGKFLTEQIDYYSTPFCVDVIFPWTFLYGRGGLRVNIEMEGSLEVRSLTTVLRRLHTHGEASGLHPTPES